MTLSTTGIEQAIPDRILLMDDLHEKVVLVLDERGRNSDLQALFLQGGVRQVLVNLGIFETLQNSYDADQESGEFQCGKFGIDSIQWKVDRFRSDVALMLSADCLRSKNTTESLETAA